MDGIAQEVTLPQDQKKKAAKAGRSDKPIRYGSLKSENDPERLVSRYEARVQMFAYQPGVPTGAQETSKKVGTVTCVYCKRIGGAHAPRCKVLVAELVRAFPSTEDE
jgi:hypothetical protein